jgi:hypothetical protein
MNKKKRKMIGRGKGEKDLQLNGDNLNSQPLKCFVLPVGFKP